MVYLKDLRNQKGLTLQQVSTDLKISPSLLSKLENGLIYMNSKYRNLLENYYNVPFKIPTSDISLLQILKEYSPGLRTPEDAYKLLKYILADYEDLKAYNKINTKTINDLKEKINKIHKIIIEEE